MSAENLQSYEVATYRLIDGQSGRGKELVEDPQGPHQTRWLLAPLVDSDVYTSRNLNEYAGVFSPGPLDALTYSNGLLIPRNGSSPSSSAGSLALSSTEQVCWRPTVPPAITLC